MPSTKCLLERDMRLSLKHGDAELQHKALVSLVKQQTLVLTWSQPSAHQMQLTVRRL